MEKYEVPGHCASCRFWMTTLSPEDRAEAARYENTDGVCDMFNEDGFSPNDYCSRWEAVDKQTNLEWFKNQIQTMDAEEISEFIEGGGIYSFCNGRDCLDYNSDCATCFRAWLEEEHNEL